MPNHHPALSHLATHIEFPASADGIAPELKKEILEARTKAVERMTKGHCKSMESYADLVGLIRALDFVLGFADRKLAEISPASVPVEED